MYWFRNQLFLVTVFTRCYLLDGEPVDQDFALESSAQYNARSINNNLETCSCLDENDRQCVAFNCTCASGTRHECKSETNFCRFKRCFGKACELNWGGAFCSCGPADTCKGRSKNIGSPRILIDTAPSRGDLHHMYAFAEESMQFGNNWTMHYDTGSGLSFVVGPELFHAARYDQTTTDESYLAFWYHFPYPESKRYSITLTMSDATKLNGSVRRYDVVPKNAANTCYPTVHLRACWPDVTKTPTMPRKDMSVVTSITPSCKGSTLTNTLRVTTLGVSASEPPFPVFFPLSTKQRWKYDYSNNWYLTFKNVNKSVPFKSDDLRPWLNAISLEVVETPARGTTYLPGKTVAICYLKVKVLKTKPAIVIGEANPSGFKLGPVAELNRGEALVLDGKLYSENWNNRKVPPLGFEWYCWDQADPGDRSVCKGSDVVLSTDPIYTPQFKLVYNRPYVFQLTTFDAAMDTKTKESRASTQQTIKVVFKPKTVKAVIKGGDEMNYTGEEWIIMESEGTVNPNLHEDGQKGTLGYSWSCWDRANPDDTSVCPGRLVEISEEPNFNVELDLVETHSYVFRLTAFDKQLAAETNATHGSALQTVNMVPFGTPVIVVISGGNAKNYSRWEPVRLDTAGSSNPNDPDDPTGSLGFSWACWDRDNPEDVSICRGKDFVLCKDAAMDLSQYRLKLLRPYVFQVTAFDRTLAAETIGTHSKAEQVVTVMSTTKPVKAVISGDSDVTHMSGARIVLDGTQTSNPNVPDDRQEETLGFSWACWDVDEPSDVSACSGPDVEISTDSYFVLDFALLELRTYMFQLTAFDKMLAPVTNSTHSRAYQTVHMTSHDQGRLANICKVIR